MLNPELKKELDGPNMKYFGTEYKQLKLDFVESTANGLIESDRKFFLTEDNESSYYASKPFDY